MQFAWIGFRAPGRRVCAPPLTLFQANELTVVRLQWLGVARGREVYGPIDGDRVLGIYAVKILFGGS
jgi:hypothetical protein